MFPALKETKAAGCCLDNFATIHDTASVSPATVDAIFKACVVMAAGGGHVSCRPWSVDLRALVLYKPPKDGKVDGRPIGIGECLTSRLPLGCLMAQEKQSLHVLFTTPSPEELLRQQQLELNEVADNLGAEDIVDVISNFIADVDPTLQVSLRLFYKK